ncbi:MAG: PepSY domain-containing protein [Cellvibrionaceae bacterium]|nr:PepSY domain-containing protein [Cellvibrionaceae bacterium]
MAAAFFYPLHYSLNWHWKNIGYWIVGLAAMVMMAALISGVVIHRKMFREFFTFRPQKQIQRSALDLHNMTGVVALPFHFFFAFTGLAIFAAWLYLPLSSTLLKPLHDHAEVQEAENTGLPHERSGIPASIASVDAMVAEAKRRWTARDMPGEVGYLAMYHLGDSNGYISIFRAGSDRVALVGEGIHFKASTGELLREDPPRSVVGHINGFLIGLHLQHFEHWLLRWLYALGGLLGCACIATGFVFFVEKRKKQHAKSGSQGSRFVDALGTTVVTGILVATMAMLVSNRLLPSALAGKGDWEKLVFWGAWLLASGHALWRSGPVAVGKISPAWREQCWLVALLAVTAVALNWLTTGDHLGRTLFAYWPVAGVDLSLMASALASVFVARELGRREYLRAVTFEERMENKSLEAAHV